MSNTFTANLSEEAQEALKFLQKNNIDVNQTVNRTLMRAAQEAGWHISLVPETKADQENTVVKPTPLEYQPGDENTHRLIPVDQAQNGVPVQPADQGPASGDKPFEPGMVLSYTASDQDISPRQSSIMKKLVVEPVAEIRKIDPV